MEQIEIITLLLYYDHQVIIKNLKNLERGQIYVMATTCVSCREKKCQDFYKNSEFHIIILHRPVKENFVT